MRTETEILADVAAINTQIDEIRAERDWWMEQTSSLIPGQGDFNTYELCDERLRLSELIYDLQTQRRELHEELHQWDLENGTEDFYSFVLPDEEYDAEVADYEVELTVDAVEVVGEIAPASEEDVPSPLLLNPATDEETVSSVSVIRTIFSSFLAFVAWILSGRSRHLRPTTVVVV